MPEKHVFVIKATQSGTMIINANWHLQTPSYMPSHHLLKYLQQSSEVVPVLEMEKWGLEMLSDLPGVMQLGNKC